MIRISRFPSWLILAVVGLASLVLQPACNTTSGTSGGTGRLNVLVTDAATDDWQEVSVFLKSISLRTQGSWTYTEVWNVDPANPAAGKINLIDLSGVALILGQVSIAQGTYDRLKLVIDTDPNNITLIDDAGAEVDHANITVVDPSGKGEIKVDLEPAITVDAGGTANLQVDFDLAHPLSIVNLSGKVVISLKVRHKALRPNVREIQFARTLGTVTALAQDSLSFTMKTLQEAEITFGVSANTIYVDADNPSQPGSFAGLAVDKGVLVYSNLNADGSLFARRVWYSSDINKLPQFTPEGLVRRVGSNWIKILQKRTETTSSSDHHHDCNWESAYIYVDDKTAWTFQTDVSMGTGTGVLQHIRRGFRVDVTLDPNATIKLATAINVYSAHSDGLITETSETGFNIGWWWHSRTMPYSTITGHEFGWWYYGLDWTRSTVIQDFRNTVEQARTADLWVFAKAELYWDQAGGQWAVENLVLAPLKLHDFTKIKTGYTAASGSMVVSTFHCWDETSPVDWTVKLDATGDFQTIVGSFKWNSTTKIFSVILPVPSTDWETLLTPDVHKVKVWVRPVKEGESAYAWHAYTVLAYQFIE